MENYEKLFLGGAVVAGLVEAGLEALFESDPARWKNTFPFLATPYPLPPLDDCLVALGSGIVYLYGATQGDETAETAGIGALAYSGPYVLHHIILNIQKGR